MKNALPAILIIMAFTVALMVTNVVTGIAYFRQRSQTQQLRQQPSEAEAAAPVDLPVPGPISTKNPRDLGFALSRTSDLRLLKAVLDEHPELVNAVSGSGRVTPLGIAVFTHRAPIVQELLRRGADVNLRNAAGLTPLHDCANKGTKEIALMLLDHGADLTIRNNAGQTPLQYAIQQNRPDIAQLFREH